MNYNIINSGSDGNATIINDIILLDCGVPFKMLQPFYNKLELVLLTHIHSDHFNQATVNKLAKLKPALRFGCGEWLVDHLLLCGVKRSQIDVYKFDVNFDYGVFRINQFELFHDVPQCGYRIFMNNKKLIYATDTNTMNHIEARVYDVYLIEANYENDETLHSYAESPELEKRIKSNHMSKEDTIKWLLENMNESSVYEFMHQHKDKKIAQRFVLIKPLLEKVSDITLTDYELNDYGIYNALEELIESYNHLKSEFEESYALGTHEKVEDYEYGE